MNFKGTGVNELTAGELDTVTGGRDSLRREKKVAVATISAVHN